MSPTAARRLVFGVTMARLPFALAFFLCSYVPDDRARWAMVALCLLVEASDLLDGYLARRLGVTTPFGAMMDSTVDHVVRTTEAVALLAVDVLPAPLLVVMIGRDAAVSAIRQLSLRRSGHDEGTRRSGKLKGIAQGVCLVTLTTTYAIAAQPTMVWRTLNSVVVAVALLVTVVSLLDYSVAYWRSTRPLPAPTADAGLDSRRHRPSPENDETPSIRLGYTR
ncbi:CDP-alcohol phosphatidyltransferase family protein [Mycobacterium sp. Aquia_213]|uniref:CDP-alcohol phosphatidyltransferase family protein n=1 Tax=Mycobacterium sp. Aquia_213 TaxID=2991728 RepID=UPI00226FC89D|nr:CDP-alcohol phosphatidyltransferase family protein [Mycobacterium sp. Aquia_213]WAC94507.1 CDP-alcohol phosphatidyltransferase family protein [Mycobacterium sp. Aquia_213]